MCFEIEMQLEQKEEGERRTDSLNGHANDVNLKECFGGMIQEDQDFCL